MIAVVAVTRIPQPGMMGILVAHLAIPVLAWLVVHAPPSRTGRILRAAYPIVLVVGLYTAIDVLNGFGAASTRDHLVQRFDQALFGMQPSRDWWRAAPSAFWSTVMHLAYLSFYVVVPGPLVYFLRRRENELLERYLDGVFITFLACYLIFALVPVSGPYYQFPRPTGAFVANLPARLVYALLRSGSAYGAAFPSSHVAAMVAATIGGWRGSRRLGMALAIPTALLTVGVVYCQMHYVADSVAGLLLGALVGGIATRKRKGDSP